LKAGQVLIDDYERSGRPGIGNMTESAEKVRELIHEDHC
jgi:hypothetical protein